MKKLCKRKAKGIDEMGDEVKNDYTERGTEVSA